MDGDTTIPCRAGTMIPFDWSSDAGIAIATKVVKDEDEAKGKGGKGGKGKDGKGGKGAQRQGAQGHLRCSGLSVGPGFKGQPADSHIQ